TSSAARRLPKSGQLFCWVQTAKIYHDTRALAINETWLSRCDHGELFTGDFFPSDDIPYSTVFAGIPDSYYNLFYKSRYAFYYIYHFVSKNFDWYLKADDDTYVIVEHLKEYLSTLDPNKPYYLGYVLKPYLEHGYNAGGAGYVLSKAALKIFNDLLYNNEEYCPDNIYEDVGIGNNASLDVLEVLEFTRMTHEIAVVKIVSTHIPRVTFFMHENIAQFGHFLRKRR
ncbi:unnamed protein product, partial [Cylicostephanus goldi]